MTVSTKLYAVDRIEGSGRSAQVVLVEDTTGTEVQVKASALGGPVHEGAMIRVPVRGTQPVWAEAVLDPAAEAARREEMEGRTARLRRGDPGGDLSL